MISSAGSASIGFESKNCSRSPSSFTPDDSNLAKTNNSEFSFVSFGWRVFVLLASAAALIGPTSCSRSPTPTANSAPVAPRWTYPVTGKMRLGVLPCRVVPRAFQTINSPFTGLLHISVDRPQTNLPAGFVWGEFEPKQHLAESNALAEAKARLDEKERLLLELELPKQKVKDAKDIDELQRQIAYVEVLRTNQALAGLLAGLMPVKEHSVTSETLERSKVELGLLEKHHGYLQATNMLALGVDTQLARTELEHRQLEFERLSSQATLKIPFACQLSISFQLAEGVADYPVNSGQELAVLRDLSIIHLRTILSDPSWSTLPTDKLKAVISLPDGSRLEAPFAFSHLEKIQMREDTAYYFQFPANRAAAAARLMGTDVYCELWLDLPERVRVVPKFALVLNQPSAFQGRRWNEGVAQISPGARVLVEGQTDLAITLPNASAKNEPADK